MKRTITLTILILLLIGAVVTVLFLRGTNDQMQQEGESGITPRSFLPFGPSSGTDDGVVEEGGQGGVDDEDVTTPRPISATLRQLTKEPTTAGVIFKRNGEVFIRSFDRATGHSTEHSATSTQQQKLTNTTIPGIQEAVWVGTSTAVLRYLKDDGESIETFLASLPDATTTSELEGQFLPINISFVSASPRANEFFVLQTTKDGSVGSIYSTDGAREIVLATPLTELLPQWFSPITVNLTTKPSYEVSGTMFFLNTQNGAFEKVYGGLFGLTTKTDGTGLKTLVTSAEGKVHIFDFANNLSTNIGIRTLADKCVWGKKDVGIVYCGVPETITSKELPDSWYQGGVSFEDSLWKIDIRSGELEYIPFPAFFGDVLVDMVDLMLSEDGTYLLFRNKKDSTLWLFTLPQEEPISDFQEIP